MTTAESETNTSNSDYSVITSSFELTDNDIIDIEETVYSLLYDYINDNPLLYSKTNFREIIDTDIVCFIINDLVDSDSIIKNIRDYYKMTHMITNAIDMFFTNNIFNIPPRSHHNSNVKSSMEKEFIDKQIKYLQQLPQPEQKTPEWYKYRHGLITASNIYKVFASQCQINSLIYEKCKPFVEKVTAVNNQNNAFSTSSLQWGVLYEPVSVLLYEHMYSTNVSDFGCIQHEKYKYIGASPDGINTNPNSTLYGRMIEIKNIVNRDITGIPKEEYWVQTQIQMETCGLDECDFVETRFKEYDDADQFYTDDTKQRGIILCFIDEGNTNSPPTYVYSRMDLTIDINIVQKWIEYEKGLETDKFVLINTRYWYLDEYSCVLVKRNTAWFNAALPMIKDVWDTIEKERIAGYEHRAPKRKTMGQCLFISKETDNVTTTRTIKNINPSKNSSNILSVVKL
jgi:hypothetical protein